jgi:hypothetical protein
VPATLQYVRRKHNVDLPGAPSFALPGDLDSAGILGTALTAAADQYGGERLVTFASVMKHPEIVWASPARPDGSRRVWLAGAVREDDGDPARVAIVDVEVNPRAKRRRGGRLTSAELLLYREEDETALRRKLENIYLECDRPLRIVRVRGRLHGPPVAVWAGIPATGLPGDLEERLPAIAALDGYELRILPLDPKVPILARQAVHDARPELLFLWRPHLPSAKFELLLKEGASDAVQVDLDVSDETLADAVREWFAQATVEFEAQEDADAPATVKAAVEQAADDAEHLVYASQAYARAKESEYKSPAEIAAGLEKLDELAGIYAAGSFAGPMKQLFLEHSSLIYRNGISEAVRTRWKGLYSVPWEGEDRLMGPHICFGSAWTNEGCARVYWYVDDSTRQWIVGHVGRHLPGAKD